MRIGYLECFSGISGDMLLGALVDAGVPFAHLEATTAALNVGARLEMRKVMRGGIAGTKVDVLVDEPQPASTHSHSHHDHPHETHTHAPHRHLSAILNILAAAPLSESVKARSTRAFQLLGEAEAAIHSIPIEKVHFHEVGAVDTIVDIVCAAAGCESLGIDRWLSSPLNVGSGTVVCQHGTLPVPAPATLALLGNAPVYASGPPMERVTPTGAAVLRMLDVCYEPLPPMRIAQSGYGAGGRDTPGEPNLLRLLVGETDDADPGRSESIAIIESVIDDSSPQLLGYVSELLLAAGAWDVYRVAVQMKKSRTGVQLTVLCRPDLVPALRDLIFRETTTIGLHWRIENKVALAREFLKVETQWGQVQIKIARWPSGKIANASPEFEDCRKIAAQHALPLKFVMQEAMCLYAASETAKEL
jgi:pyridinium-3,5-bisthiocarboxylic acid mononucleotide nickel chelatase